MSEESQAILEEVYCFLRAFIGEHGFSPSIREIARGCYLSAATSARYLDKLEARGRITRVPGQARSTRLADDEGPPEN